MWGVAQISWFYANQELGFSTAFPLITSGPGLVGALWGFFVFHEIQGKRNYRLLAGGIISVVCAGLFIALSRRMGEDRILFENCGLVKKICDCFAATSSDACISGLGSMHLKVYNSTVVTADMLRNCRGHLGTWCPPGEIGS